MHDFKIKVKDNKLKAIVGTSMFRNRVEKNAKAYTRKLNIENLLNRKVGVIENC